MKKRVYIHTNEKQWVGALVAAYALKRNSANPDAFDVEFLQVKDFDFLKQKEGCKFLRGGVDRIWHLDDLQSFTPLRFLPPKLMGYEGRAVVMDPDIFGFTSSVLHVCSTPYPYLHLSYPEEMEQITVRKAQRVRVKLFASAKNSNPEFQSEKPRPVTVVDISTSGAQVIADQPLGDVGDRLQLNCLIKVGTSEKLLAIPALLRNVHLEDDRWSESYSHGMQFELIDQQDIFPLHGFVYEQIVKLQSD